MYFIYIYFLIMLIRKLTKMTHKLQADLYEKGGFDR